MEVVLLLGGAFVACAAVLATAAGFFAYSARRDRKAIALPRRLS